ncbi:MAG TPA: hypothetical protein VM914_14345, partial [Pyrinomonadaceae bacterium]|nr:hypothetical protein [Pyrinomonadaceae bacterium]
MTERREETQPPPLVLRGARVVTPARALERADVYVERGSIARITSEESDADAPDADVRDLSGLTLYPGFVDVH